MAEEVQALDNGKDLPEAGEAAPEQDLNAELGALREQAAPQVRVDVAAKMRLMWR